MHQQLEGLAEGAVGLRARIGQVEGAGEPANLVDVAHLELEADDIDISSDWFVDGVAASR